MTRIVIDFDGLAKFEFVCENPTIFELKQIIYQIYNSKFGIYGAIRYEKEIVMFKDKCIFSKMKDEDIIAPFIDKNNNKNNVLTHKICRGIHFSVFSRVRDKYKIIFDSNNAKNVKRHAKNHKQVASVFCPLMMKYGSCAFFTQDYSLELEKKDGKLNDILYHLSQFEHGSQMCKETSNIYNKCVAFNNILNNKSNNIQDRIHLHLYNHQPLAHLFKINKMVADVSMVFYDPDDEIPKRITTMTKKHV